MKTIPVMIRIQEDVWKKLKGLAKKLNMTRQELVREDLQKLVDGDK